MRLCLLTVREKNGLTFTSECDLMKAGAYCSPAISYAVSAYSYFLHKV